MNLNNITTALKTGITIYQYEQWQNTGSVNLMQKESHMLSKVWLNTNIQDLKKLLLNPYTIYTYDYADGLIINDTTEYLEIFEIEIEDEPFDEFLGNIITYASEKDLFENLRENLIRMDLTKGADDQYYDYSPSQVEAILFGILQLTPEHQDIIVIDLKKQLKSFIQDKDQAEEMINPIYLLLQCHQEMGIQSQENRNPSST